MSNDLNQCNFIGRLGRDAESVNTSTGTAMTKFSIAVSEEYLSKGTAEKVKSTEWVNCVAFGKLADVCAKYLKKGSKVYVSGKFKTNKYVNKDGVEKVAFQINVNELQMLNFVDQQEEKVDTSEFTDEDIPF